MISSVYQGCVWGTNWSEGLENSFVLLFKKLFLILRQEVTPYWPRCSAAVKEYTAQLRVGEQVALRYLSPDPGLAIHWYVPHTLVKEFRLL